MNSYIIILCISLNYFLIPVNSIESKSSNVGIFSTNICDNIFLKHECVSMPSRSFIGDYTVAPKYKLNACHIGKSFSSVTLSIFCYLNNKKVFLKKYGTSKDKINFRDMCGRENNHHNLPDIYKKYTHSNKTEFFENWNQPFHPYCFGCYNNVECFLQNLYFDIKAVQNNLKEPNTFIKYHFYPQTWQCDYTFFKDKYKILHYNDDMEAFYNNYLYELQDNNVPKDDLLFINEMFHTVKVRHSTFDKKEIQIYRERIMNNPYILSLISKIFYHDFIEFNFNLPKI
uniref:Uncharacterized protein n=1 Tax=Strongyloides papillosus TaxID=174720 RepID=A0A0N5C112_STREA